MTEFVRRLVSKLEQRFRDELINCMIEHGQITLVLRADDLISVCKVLRDDSQFSFVQLSDLCGVDYATYGQVDWITRKATATGFSRGREEVSTNIADKAEKRFAVVYHLLSIHHNMRLRLRVFPDGEPPKVASVTEIWNSADWYEREAFDLFGILFDGHPDLRRILTDYGFIGHPFRKDFPLEGNVEVRYDPDKQRVVYQPVTISNRVLVPRVLHQDNRYVDSEEEQDNA